MIAKKHIPNTILLFFSGLGVSWVFWQREIMVIPYLSELWHTIYKGTIWGIVYDFSYLFQIIGFVGAAFVLWFWSESSTKHKIALSIFLLIFFGSIGVHEYLLLPNTIMRWNTLFNFFWGIWIPWSLATILLLTLEMLCLAGTLGSIWYWEE